MLLSKFQIGGIAGVVSAITIAHFWVASENRHLQSEISRRSTLAIESRASLEKQLRVESQRLADAETKVAALLEAANKHDSARTTSPARAGLTTDADTAVKAVLARASKLIREGKPAEALGEYLNAYRELQAIRPGSSECQRLMGVIKTLGRIYPAALTGLSGLRDAAMLQLQAQPERRDLPFEIALLNERLGEGSRTLAIFDALPPADPARQSLAMVANAAFIEARRYEDALLGQPFGRMLAWTETGASAIAKQDAALQGAIRKSIAEGTLSYIEVLTGAGRAEDARILTERLLAFDNSDATRAALSRHVARAQLPKP
jgi:hypothetical protein